MRYRMFSMKNWLITIISGNDFLENPNPDTDEECIPITGDCPVNSRSEREDTDEECISITGDCPVTSRSEREDTSDFLESDPD